MNHRALALGDRTPAPGRRTGWKILAIIAGAGALVWMLSPRGPARQDEDSGPSPDDPPRGPGASPDEATEATDSRSTARPSEK